MDELQRLTKLLVNQVSHWTPARWGDRGDAFHQTLQRIVGPQRALPRLSDLALPDQLRVVVADLLANGSGPAEISRACQELEDLRGTLKASQ